MKFIKSAISAVSIKSFFLGLLAFFISEFILSLIFFIVWILYPLIIGTPKTHLFPFVKRSVFPFPFDDPFIRNMLLTYLAVIIIGFFIAAYVSARTANKHHFLNGLILCIVFLLIAGSSIGGAQVELLLQSILLIAILISSILGACSGRYKAIKSVKCLTTVDMNESQR